jgi:hypothetical protein
MGAKSGIRAGHQLYTRRTSILGSPSVDLGEQVLPEIALTKMPKPAADGLNRKSGQPVAKSPLRLEHETLEHLSPVTGTHFDPVNCSIQSSAFFVGRQSGLVRLKGGAIKNTSLFFQADRSKLELEIMGVEGTPIETGP